MRDLKFRGYDPVNNKMVFADLDETEKIESWVAWDNPVDSPTNSGTLFDVMQYIGIKDKCAREVYRGDVLRAFHFKDSDGKIHYLHHEVRWSDRFNGWFARNTENKSDDETGSLQMWIYAKNNEFEVIGNIYENPELIEMVTK
tara:strand:- start:271 stop:699 length:429 start_codon:yes stop_codon:yes gene_type:complete